MTLDEQRRIVDDCRFKDYRFFVRVDGRGATYLQGEYRERDTVTGALEEQVTRRWFLSPMMTRSEIVQTVFKCVLTSAEHRVREWFRYRNRAVFGPHFDVEQLWELCGTEKAIEAREK